MIAISSATAIPVYGTFSGTLTSVGGVFGYYGYPPFAVGDTVTGTYEYTPALLTGGSTDFSDPTADFSISINGTPVLDYPGSNLNLVVGANGEPVSGSGVGGYDLFIGVYSPGDLGMVQDGIYTMAAQVTYSTPSATVPDTASTLCLSGIAMLSLAVFGRLSFHPWKGVNP